MRIAVLHPSYWPEVRRGGERLVHDVAAGLAARGHDVTLVTSHGGGRTLSEEDGFTVVRNRRLPTRLVHRRSYEFHLTNAPAVARELLVRPLDLVHAFHPVDAWAAVRVGRAPVVYSMNGIPARQFLVARRYRLPMIEAAVRGAAEVTVLSEAAAEPFRRYLGRDPAVVPGGVFTDRFTPGARDERPTIVCAASLNDARKRGRVLMDAFGLLLERRPDARLVLAGLDDPTQGEEPLSLPPGATAAPALDDGRVARAYSSAWVSVLPAIYEAFGLVLVESLATGTPVVAARSGACPEVLDDDAVGRLFEPDNAGAMATAMDEALTLARQPGTVERCRAHARRWDWERILPRYEEVYERALSSAR